MKINRKILSIPPFISTSWKNVLSLHVENRGGFINLLVELVNGSTIKIPNLDEDLLEAIFSAHEKFLELEAAKEKEVKNNPLPSSLFPGAVVDESSPLLHLPIQIGIEGGIGMGNPLQHNSEASNSPDLPHEILEKIASFSKAINLGNVDNLPKPEPHCNCMHCQIMRVMRNKPSDEEEDCEITEEDLKFCNWEIEQKKEDKRLYVVTNRLDEEEHYNVFLGKPIGCTCGSNNCEHIEAVLNS